MQYTQEEFLGIINRYNNAERKDIKINLLMIFKKKGIRNKQIMEDTKSSVDFV